MSKRPENSDPIASAGQIDDPDQPVSRNDDHPTDQQEQSEDDPDHPKRSFRHRRAHGASAAGAAHSDEHAARRRGKTPKALKETGFPNVDAAEVEAQHGHDVDSSALAAGRKFHPPAGRKDPNLPNLPPAGQDFHVSDDHELSNGARNDRDGDDSEAESYGTPENSGGPEPITHSRAVEDRVQQQEHDFDLGVTEEGERYVTPHEDR
ncbi:hypothetical protein [Kocuria sp. cx-455]|uniref:hypothetical protein n=1 Tax=Kocuria sp. cx-455 TaxID=2771377 RepID=UPI003D7124AA